ncbi:hypothetical protein LK994_13530 [Ferruginibacter lapsinanis]|uniref:hypothetical protein n=1 Tax=Ferruginibacter lapsinanis TaxID=563172 RepID=UPI001E639D48|nr:hypothetical protein [Ferruginibacter lapsinanis]UEG49658.1 hypothetical protein LK994_13530 [Ferruginibacter lapsinanis]
MRFIQHYLFMLILFFTQTVLSQNYSPWQHPVIKAADQYTPGFLALHHATDDDHYIPLAIFDTQKQQLYYVTTFGKIFDSIAVGPKLAEQIALKNVDVFDYFSRLFTMDCLEEIHAMRTLVTIHANDLKKYLPENSFINYTPLLSAPGSSDKLSLLDNYERSIWQQCILMNTILYQPVNIYEKKDSLKNYEQSKLKLQRENNGNAVQYVGYINNNSILSKAVLNMTTATVYIYDKKNIVADSFKIKPTRLHEIDPEKADLFAIYRSWLQWQLAYTCTFLQKQAATNKRKTAAADMSSKLVRPAQEHIKLLQQKISYTLIPDMTIPLLDLMEKAMTDVRKKWSNSTGWQDIGIGTSEVFYVTRGNKQYNLTNQVGNVMATVSDKKIYKTITNSSGNGYSNTIGLFVPDVVTATDYYPGGMQMPGRIYPVPQNEQIQPVTNGGSATAPIILYKHSFEGTPIGSKPYVAAPNTIDSHLNNSSWTTSQPSFGNYDGVTGKSLSLPTATPTESTITLTFNLSSGYTINVSSFSFYCRNGGSSGYQQWQLSVNNVNVGNGNITGSFALNTVNLSGPATFSGTVKAVLTLSGGNHGSTNVFRLDDFTLNGYMQQLPGAVSNASATDKAKYPYSINGQMRSDEIVVNTTTAEFGEYDSRLMRRWNLDPKPDVSVSPYTMYSNNPIIYSDIALDTPRNAGNGQLGQQFRFTNDGTIGDGSSTDPTFLNMQNSFLANLNQQINQGGHTYNGNNVSLNTSDPLATVINVTFGATGTSHSSMAGSSMYISLSDMSDNANVSTHEWLHTAGLMDRYYELYGRANGAKGEQFVEKQRANITVPMGILPSGHDDNHNGMANMMSNLGNQITSMQWGIVYNLQSTGRTEESLGTLGKVSFVYTYDFTYNSGYMKALRQRALKATSSLLIAQTNRIAFSSTSAFSMKGLNGTTLLAVPSDQQSELPARLNNYIIHTKSGNILGSDFYSNLQWEKDQLNTIQR